MKIALCIVKERKEVSDGSHQNDVGDASELRKREEAEGFRSDVECVTNKPWLTLGIFTPSC